MKVVKLLSLAIVVLLTACSTVPVENKMNSAVIIDSSLNKNKSDLLGNVVNVRKLTVERHEVLSNRN